LVTKRPAWSKKWHSEQNMATATLEHVDRAALVQRFRRVRQASIDMCRPLQPEDFRQQPMADVSPPWWNLGHTSWFFVRHVLRPLGGQLEPDDDVLDFVLNSYYASCGPRLQRARRGSLTRPTTAEVYRYRESVDRRVERLLETADEDVLLQAAPVLRIGIEHEQQHQELFYTEIKYILAQNPPALRESYLRAPHADAAATPRDPPEMIVFPAGLFQFGHREPGWCWDNELPVHLAYLPSFALANRLVTNREYLEFMNDGGYSEQLLWLDNGWNTAEEHGWHAPLYWERVDHAWHEWTLAGLRPLALDEPVCHVSFYEADAFARWRSAHWRGGALRLPSEYEWEHAARRQQVLAGAAAFLESGRLHPAATTDTWPLAQMAGVLWQWTQSYYAPYPGYRPFAGALAEYNGKFMDNQRVLRGGSCVTPWEHFRQSYRNFWSAATRFQFTGIRLAQDVNE
jgi:ergothioneine biosynthesis protein EgtB